MPVCAASEIWPIIREYERTVTACISGYVQPKVAHYLTAFEQALSGLGVPAAPHITKSNGGVMGVEQAKSECVQMILSGTASGVIGAGFLAQATGLGKILSLDIGGTSADVAVIVDGQAEYGSGELIGEFQIHIPSISVTSIGQGGGSIAWVDELGILKVGPESAGSRPGPACFGKGGTRPAVTDAFAVCGWIGHTDLATTPCRSTPSAPARPSPPWPSTSAPPSRIPPRTSSASRSPACSPTPADWSRGSGSTRANSISSPSAAPGP